jgi:uncharacterized damage-inducible protein DinB
MRGRTLTPLAGHDRDRRVVATLAAQLDPLLASLRRRVENATVEELEWQPRPGVNTIGMLIAHMAASEAFWMLAASRGIDAAEESDAIVFGAIGIHIDDDGLPLKPGGAHPTTLAGKTAAEYLTLLSRARQSTHETLGRWVDADLDRTRIVDGKEVSGAWLVAHIVEHSAQHLGQIALLTSLRQALRAR